MLRSLDGGWDNDNFLDSLGKTTEDQDQANDGYYQMSRYGPPPKEEVRSSEQQSNQQQWATPNMNISGFQQPPPPAPLSQQQSSPPMDAFAQLQQQQQQQMLELQRQQQQQLQLLQQQQLQQLQLQQSVQGQQFGQQPNVQQPNVQQPQQFGQQQNVQQPPQQFGQQQYVQQPPQQFEQKPAFDASKPNPGDEDELPTQDIEGAMLTDEMKAKMKVSHTQEEEESQGGQVFRNLMARAKQKSQQQPVQPVPQRQISNVPIPDNAENLSVHEQARLFRDIMLQRQRELVQQQQQQQQQPTNSYAQQQLPNYPYSAQNAQPQFLPQGIGFDGRKIGRNKDADAISTSADVYLAKLKRDSTTRRIARDAGDFEKANEIFHDPSIQEITAPVNPYLEDRRQRERDMLETVPEEMLIFQEYSEEDPAGDGDAAARSYSGISFREKLAQAKQRKLEGGGN